MRPHRPCTLPNSQHSRWARRALRTIAVALAISIGASLFAPSATALSLPAVPTGAKLASATATSLTATASPTAGATGYQLYASTTRSSVYVVNISKARRSAVFAKPTATLSGLAYSTATWHYRFAAVNAKGARYSEILMGNLRPATPVGLRARSSTGGTYLSWTNGGALGYRIAQSTDPTMSAERVNYTTTSRALQFTPYGLRRGTRYYFRIAAANSATRSPYGALVSVVVLSRELRVRVQTYNVLASNTAGLLQGDGPLATWGQRRAGVARLIRAAAPDVVGLQEGNGWVGTPEGYGGTRQVDDLQRLIADPYGKPVYNLARTEVPPTEHRYLRTGRYILYKKSAYLTSGAGGYWDIGSSGAPRHAAHQVLQHRTTGAKFLFVSAHLSYLGGAAGDTQRQSETESLVRQASEYAAYRNVPIIYVGDFNSHEGSNHVFDGPGIAFRAAAASDALEVAQVRTNAQYNSANQNFRTPPASGRSIDHVYAPPGVALRTWQLGLELTYGRFVGDIPSDHNPLSVDAVIPW
ncbi:MAG TPA: endonuclease/exonuclease/phosphatase family protein [Propionibacteriaceae bacterium]